MVKLAIDVQSMWGWPIPHLSQSQFPAAAPSSSWDGSAQSGFSVIPTDPVRTTAKPALRMLEPPNQRFTDALVIGAIAFALDGDTLIGGIDRVRFHFEGTTLDVLAPSYRSIARADGSTYACLGYWAQLRKPSGITGTARLYVEAVPADAAMQSRIIGPFDYSLAEEQHDFTTTVGAAGDFQSLIPALNAVRSAGAKNGLVELLDDGDYIVTTDGLFYEPENYTTIRAAPGVKARVKRVAGDEGPIRPRHTRTWWERIEFDPSTITEIRNESSGQFAYRHCRINDPSGRSLLLKAARPVSWFFRGKPWQMENDYFGAYEVGNASNLMRGCHGEQLYGDFADQVSCAMHNSCLDLDDRDVASSLDALTITYSGTGTASLSGTDGGSGTLEARTFRFFVDAIEVGSFAAWRSYKKANSGDGLYEISDLAAFINSLPGWSAAVLNNDRQAASLTEPANVGGFSGNPFPNPVAVGSGLTLVSSFGLHQDGFVHSGLGVNENVIVFGNTIKQAEGQLAYMPDDGNGNHKDVFYVNNLFELLDGAGQVSNLDEFSAGASHVVIAHNTWIRQNVDLDMSAISNSARCLVSNNVAPMIRGDLGQQTGRGNHLQSDGNGTPATGLADTVVAGTLASIYAAPESLDFSPVGELLANLQPPVISFDLVGLAREGPGPVGAIG